jgi:AGZA family xanthine/uracil permease-like MFS transporter
VRAALERHFSIRGAGSDVRTEVIAGATTFLTMAYIVVVNPAILKAAGMPVGAVITATCLSAAFASFLMGWYGRLPIGVAPGMGTNAYFAFTVCGTLGHSWQTALGAVFISGVLFLVLSVTGVRERIIEAIPDSMKHAIAAGIGIFIAFVGLINAKIIVDRPTVLVGLGDVTSYEALVTFVGLVACGVLLARGVRGALLYGIAIATALAMVVGVAKVPEQIVAMPPSMSETFLAMDLKAALGVGVLELIFAFAFVDLFDSIATLIGVADQGGMLAKKEEGTTYLPGATRALSADAVGTMVGAAFGTSTVTSYVESTSGIAAGGRTGLTAVVTGLGFLAMLFVSPLIGVVPWQATAPVLIIVAVFMLKNLVKIAFDDLTEAIPAVVACLAIPLTFSISDGLALGFVTYPTVKLLAGRHRDIHPMMVVLALLFLAKFFFLGHGG